MELDKMNRLIELVEAEIQAIREHHYDYEKEEYIDPEYQNEVEFHEEIIGDLLDMKNEILS